MLFLRLSAFVSFSVFFCSDVVVRNEGQEFKAHKLVLSLAKSPILGPPDLPNLAVLDLQFRDFDHVLPEVLIFASSLLHLLLC